MPQMDDGTLRAIITAQYSAALGAATAAKLSSEREQALSYYNGDLSKDLPSQPGRSSAVSMDVSDTVEGIMPQLMEVFCGSDEVVKFEPVGPEDMEAAEQETDYINHVFMNQNPGFLVLYSFIKDALLEKNGIVKVWYENKEKEERETYYGKSEDEYAFLTTAEGVEVEAHTANEDGTHDVTLVRRKTYGCAKVLGVPPEEFGIESAARSIRDCNYCYHDIVDRTEADLIAQGFDADQVKKLPTHGFSTNSEEDARNTVDEQSNAAFSTSGSRRVKITEHYTRIDYKGDGKPCLYRVTTGGNEGEILRRDGKADIEEFDAIPFAAMTPIIVTHRFYGKSLADLVMDIQRIKTSLWRQALDNLYIANNPRVVVAESHATENTLDDLLVSRPQQIVRVKTPGGIEYQKSIDVSPSVYPALEYMDATREWRTGVTKQGQGIDANALQNQSATAVNQAFTAAQARVRLIARIFAETGIKDLFWLLHGVIKKHAQQAQTVRLRNNWVTVDPRNWKTRDDLTVDVGLGTGSKESQLVTLQMLIGAQKEAVNLGMVSKRNFWNSARELVKLTGRKDPEAFFVDPTKPVDPMQQQDPNAAPIEPPPDPKVAEMQVKAQLEDKKAQADAQLEMQKLQGQLAIEKMQAEADIASNRDKLQAEMMRDAQKHQLEMAKLQAQLEAEQVKLGFERERHQMSLQHADQMARTKVAVAEHGASLKERQMEKSEAE